MIKPTGIAPTCEMPCNECGAMVPAFVAQQKIVNSRLCSIIILEHSPETVCQSCLKTIVPAIADVSGISLTYLAIKEPTGLLVPSNIIKN